MNRLRDRLTKAIGLARSKDAFAGAGATIVAVAILGIWLSAVVFTTTRHEFWRDEVRDLSLARAAHSPLDLYGLTQNDGHPILWFLLLYIGKSIVDTPLVLPVTSIIIAFAAAAVLMFFSRFPFWIRCLVIFSALPFYEYSVMARPYGISMLLLFIAAALYRNRSKHPWSLAFVLALLANTNVHSAILVCLIAALWVWDTVVEQRTAPLQGRRLSLYLPLIVVFAGVLLCAASSFPRENTILTPVRHSGMRELASSLFAAVLQPGLTFAEIVPAVLPPLLATYLLYLAALGLLRRPNLFLAALGGQVAFGVLFRVVYAGGYRHQGLFLVFMLFLYWLFIESSNQEVMTRNKRQLFHVGVCAMLILLLGNVAKTKSAVWTDIRFEMSSSRAFGEFLNGSATYRGAVIAAEPDFLIQSLPYYAQNRIYLPREHRFGNTVSWTTEANARLSLGELLSAARDLKTRYGQPVLIVLGPLGVDKARSGETSYPYNKVFSWKADESADFNQSTVLIKEFKSARSDENYSIYAIR